jgi:RNA polymerase sigma-70 factor, ECF subfamily
MVAPAGRRKEMDGTSGREDWLGICELRSDVESTLRRRCPDRHELDDLVQETLIKAARNRPNLQHPSRLRSWVLRIAWNVFHDHVRREHVLRGQCVSGEELDDLQASQGTGLSVGPEERLELEGQLFDMSEMVSIVRFEVAKLSAKERGLYSAFYSEGLACAIAAERFGTSHKGVKMRLVRLRRKLRRGIRQRAVNHGPSSARTLEVVA